MKEKWSHFAKEYLASLFPTYMLPKGMILGGEKLLNQTVYISLKIEDEAITWYTKTNNWKAGHLALVKKIKNNPKFLRKIYEQMEILGLKQIKFAKQAHKLAPNAGNKKLNQLYQNFVKLNIVNYSYGLMLPLLDYQDTTFLSDELHGILQSRQADEFFNLLTTPYRDSNVKQEELALLKIYQRIDKNTRLKKLFITTPSEQLRELLKRQQPEISALLKQHTKKFCWVFYVYQGPAAQDEYFLDILKDWAKQRVNPAKKLERYRAEKQNTRAKQHKILNQLKLNSYERSIVELAKDGVFYKALRRELQSCSYYYMERVLKAIGHKLNLSLAQVRMMLDEEISNALLNNKLSVATINQRMRQVFFAQENKRTCLTGPAVQAYLKKQTIQEKLNLNVSKVAGTVAYPGKAKGRVKIINTPKQIEKMRPGDILVAQTTSPNLMPAIRQAAAIVTDEGGLTCHAAIVSRELRIPCVVGTKIGSKIFKDGDKIEVDAKKGLVKLI